MRSKSGIVRWGGAGKARLFFYATLCLMTLALSAKPVGRAAAVAAATDRLPQFFAGEWKPAGDYPLYDLAGAVAAYAFMFDRAEKENKSARRATPTEFVAERRAKLGKAEKALNGNNPELYGMERYATIVISADDTEPPVIRCFLGLPPQLVKERDAEALALRKHGQGRWRVRRRLMLGMFDEAFECEDEDGGKEALVVDMRTGKTLPLTEAVSRANAKRKSVDNDPERERMCREAWDRYRAGGQDATSPIKATAARAGVKKASVADALKDISSQTNRQGQ